jgi:multidrug transporter EmrE-like cation transporter
MQTVTLGYLWCALAALASALATLLIKLSNQHSADWNLARLSFLAGAAATYVLGFVCYSVALQKMEMSLAYPVMTGFAMVMVAAIGYAALSEPMTLSKIAGMLMIGAGAYALAR